MANTLSRNEKCIPQKWNALMLNHCIYYVCLFLTAMKNVSKCMTMFYFHTFWTIRAFHFSYQRLR